MSSGQFRFRYTRSKFWLVFWILVFFPFGLVLLINHTECIGNEQILKLEYNGSKFWLFFWTILFFPMAILLFWFKSSFVKKSVEA